MTTPAGLAHRYAPVVHLDPDEPFAPMDPEAFLADCELMWREADESVHVLAGGDGAPSIERRWLGRRGLQDRDANPYRSPDERSLPGDFTRPFDGSSARGGPGGDPPGEAEGFALRPRSSDALGRVRSRDELVAATRTARVFWELQHHVDPAGRRPATTVLCYWLFFGASTYPLGLRDPDDLGRWLLRRILGRRAVAEPLDPVARGLLDIGDLQRLWRDKVMHQGDWEGISVLLGEDEELISVHYRAHGLGRSPRPASEAPRDAQGRLVVLCAKGSHGCYDSRASAELPDLVPGQSDVLVWDTRDGELENARSRDWFGFGGAWGEPDLDGGGISLSWERDELTGPLGPSRYKGIWPQ